MITMQAKPKLSIRVRVYKRKRAKPLPKKEGKESSEKSPEKN